MQEQGFFSTQSTLQALFNTGSDNEEPKRVLLIDVSELYHTLMTEDRFALLRTYIPGGFLFDTCYDFDNFYRLLGEFRDNQDAAEGVGLEINDKIYEEVEYQGVMFVELFRDSFILPAVRRINAESTHYIGGMTANQQLIIIY